MKWITLITVALFGIVAIVIRDFNKIPDGVSGYQCKVRKSIVLRTNGDVDINSSNKLIDGFIFWIGKQPIQMIDNTSIGVNINKKQFFFTKHAHKRLDIFKDDAMRIIMQENNNTFIYDITSERARFIVDKNKTKIYYSFDACKQLNNH